MTQFSPRMGLSLCVGVCLASCASDTNDTLAIQSSSQMTGGAAAPADDSARCPAGTEEFRFGPSGLVQTDPATGIMVRLLNASAAPPIRGFNDWTLAVTDASGAPMPQAELHWACAWMPAHSHGSNPKGVKRLGNAQFQLSQQNLAMYGGWQVKLWIDTTPGGTVYDPQSGGIVGGDACRGTGVGPVPNIQFNVCVPTSPGD